MKVDIQFSKRNGQYQVSLSTQSVHAMLDYPVMLQLLHGRQLKARYDAVSKQPDGFLAHALVDVSDGTLFEINDLWADQNGSASLTRKLKAVQLSGEKAVRWTMEYRCVAEHATSFNDYEFVVPGSLYNKNDTDDDGKDDYLGTFNQDYKDDRNPTLSVTCYAPCAKAYFALIRADIPVKDETISREQINARHFIHNTDIGSLGLSPSDNAAKECILRCDYPFYERTSFCLNVDGSEWSAYHRLSMGEEVSAAYLFVAGEADTLTSAAWQVHKYQADRILDPEVRLPFTLEEARQERRTMLFNSYRYFPDQKNAPAGFCVHFSPRQKYGKYNIIEYGFCSAQAMVSYVMLRAAQDNGNAEYRERALKTLDFFVDHGIAPSGLPNGIYNVDKEQFVYWWTGILFPFQYSSDRETLVNFLGDQIVDLLMDVAEELKKVKGNYTRSMSETIFYLIKSYEKEKQAGTEHESWLTASRHFCDRMLKVQNPEGYWNRAYSMEGEPLTKPAVWFGASATEMGSGTIFVVPVMLALYQCTGEKKYLEAALRGAAFIRREYVDQVRYLGGLNDTTHIKCVKIDAIGVMYAMRAMLMAYEASGEPELLVGARDAARILATWTYIWDIPFDKDTLLGKFEFKTTGWTGCDVIPACSYVDDEFPEFVPDLIRIAHLCKDRDIATLARIVTRGMHHGLSMPQRMYDYAMPGVQCEGYMTSLWLSDTGRKEFSGAAAKNKGDDNDTCNGLINAQALVNLDYLMDTYGTLDFDQIIARALES